MNPFISCKDAPDPWMIAREGYYYFTATMGRNIEVWKAATITGINWATKVTVWTPPAFGPKSQNLWAPELHFIHNQWYIYYAADDGENANHRMYVLEATTADPQGPYRDKGKIYDSETDTWAIDGTVLQEHGSLYFIWSGWPGNTDGKQNLYIAGMSNPWTISDTRVMISRPDQPWEGWINEGPAVLKRNGKLFIIYAANSSWTPNHCLGMLVNTDGDVLNPDVWKKSHSPVFAKTDKTFGPGHCSFVKSPDGTEDWIIYHATDSPRDGWKNRKARSQRFSWNTDGTPNFGCPVGSNLPLALPSGESPEGLRQGRSRT